MPVTQHWLRNRTRRNFARRNPAFRQLICESLESRRLLAGIPSVTIDIESQAFIGEVIPASVTFDNTHPSDPGFGPFIDVYLPRNGVDGATSAPLDGLSYVPGSSNYLGGVVSTSVFVFPTGPGNLGTISHPYAVDTAGDPLQVSGPTGDQLVVFQLPFGSFTADQPAATIDFEVQLSNFADLDTSLDVRARSGFQFGNDALYNPATDPTTLSQAASSATTWLPRSSVTSTLVLLEKTYIGPEDETATGPNFPRQYRIDVDIADGQTITAADVIDTLPNNVQLVSVDTITPAGSVTTNPSTPANAPNNQLVVTFPTITGTTSDVDATVIFTYFVPFRDANAANVISPNTGNDATAPNNARFVGNWDPLDPRDAAGTDNAVADVSGPEHTLTPKSIATQKSLAIVNDIGSNGYTAGDTVEYTIEFQISDYFAFDSVTLEDVISDGQRFDTSFIPTLSLTEHGSTTSGNLNAANFSVTDRFTGSVSPVLPLNGTQEIVFDVSGELVTRSLNSTIFGGLVPQTGTGGTDPSELTFDQGATTGTIVFRAIIQDAFTDDFPSADPSVDEGDLLANDVTITGAVLSYINAALTGSSESDFSATEFTIVEGILTKSIYAINGSTTLPSPLRLAPGDTVTYRIQLTLPTSDVEDLRLEDYLPLPILNATQVTTFNDSVSAAAPAAGVAKFGPSDTFRAIFGNAPALGTDAVSNRVTFNYGDFDIDPGQSSNIDILFTVTASGAPFADGLHLTNQVRRLQGSTNNSDIADDAIVQILLGQPALSITKGVIATSHGSLSPVPAGPVGFTAPGSVGFRATGTINSTGLDSLSIDSHASGLDAGDLASFAIVVENNGSSRLGAFDVRLRDTLPAGFAIPSGGAGLNLTVTDGTGASLAFNNLGTGLFDAAGGVELVDPGSTTATGDGTDSGAIDEFDLNDGRNILIITYDLEVQPGNTIGRTLTNTATLYNYAGVEGGIDFTTQDLSDDARVTIDDVVSIKTITATNQAFTTGSNVAIGEVVTYTSTLVIPEGSMEDFVWTDTLPAGMSVVGIDGLSQSTSLASSVGFAQALLDATIAPNGSSAAIDFGTLTNSNRDNSVQETISIQLRAVVLNNAATDRGDTLVNTATATWTGGESNAGTVAVTVVEPSLDVVKTILPATGQGNDTYTVIIDVSHRGASNANAYDVSLSDLLPAGLTYFGAAPTTSGVAPTTLSGAGSPIIATWTSFPLGSTSRIQFSAQSDPDVTSGTTITNTANGTWTSLPGDVSAAQFSNPSSNERSGNTGHAGGAVNDYRDAGSDTVVIASPTVTKSLIGTNQTHTAGSNIAIGEIAVYEVVITVPQSQVPSASFLDTPDGGLAIVDVESIVASPDISTSIAGGFDAVAAAARLNADANNGASVLFDFGNLENTNTNSAQAETITIRYRAVALNSIGNNRGVVLDNQGVFRWNTSATANVDGPNLTIVEPQLAINVSNSTPASADAGDTVSFTVTLSHAGISNAHAFNVSLQNLIDSVPNHLQYVSGTLNIIGSGGAVFASSSDAGGDLSGAWTDFPLGATVTLTFDAAVQDTAPASSTLTNTADVQWTSLPGDVLTAQSSNPLSVERTGFTANVGDAANDHTTSDAGNVTTTAPGSSKTIVATSNSVTGSDRHDAIRTDVSIGETVTYSIIAVLPEGTNTLVFTDQMPTGPGVLEVLSATVGTVGGQITAGTPTINISDSNSDSINDRAVVDFGTVLNTPDGVASAGDFVEIIIVAQVVDVPTNVNAAVLTNTATIAVNGSNSIASAEVEVVEPQLRIRKLASSTSGPPGSTVPYTVTIDHAPGSTANAYDLALEDLLDDLNLDLVPGSVITSRGSIASGNQTSAPTDSTILVTLDRLELGQTLIVTFNAIVDPAIGSTVDVVNTSTITYDDSLGSGGRSSTDSDTETFSTTQAQIDLAISVTDSEDPTVIDNATTFFYTIVVTNNGPSTATDVTVVQDLPLEVSNPSGTASQGGVPAFLNGQMQVNLGTLAPGETATIIVSATTPSFPTTMNTDVEVSATETDIDPSNDTDSEPTIVLNTGSISGRSWVDPNSNGVVDAGEVLLPGVLVTLTGVELSGANVTRTALTDADGFYTFDFLRPGDYTLIQSQPTLFYDNNDYAGSAGGSQPANDSLSVSLAAGVDAVDYFFTELGLRTEMIGKRRLLNSRLSQGPGLTFSDFISLLAPRGTADRDNDGDIDSDDFSLFQGQLGSQF